MTNKPKITVIDMRSSDKGEQANIALEQTMEMEELREKYRRGEMDLQEAYELGIINELGGEE